MTPEQLEWWLKTGSIYGLGFIALAVGVGMAAVFCWKLGKIVLDWLRIWPTRIAERHVSLMSTLEDNSQTQTNASAKTADALEALTDSKASEHRRTRRALGHLTEAAKEATICKKVQAHLDRALDELRDP